MSFIRANRGLIVSLTVFAVVVVGGGFAAHRASEGSGLRCRNDPWTPARVGQVAQVDPFHVRVAAAPPGYQIDGLVGPTSSNGRPPDEMTFTYFTSDCRRTIAVNEFEPGTGSAGYPGAPRSRDIRVNGVTWRAWGAGLNRVTHTYPDGVLIEVFAYRTGRSKVLALLRALPAT